MINKHFVWILTLCLTWSVSGLSQKQILRDHGIGVGVLPTGENNAITDAGGVEVGQVTIMRGDSIRTGVTAILPHGGNLFQDKVPAAVHVGNGFGKLAGVTQIQELGTIETPVVLTNTLSVPVAANALIDHTLSLDGNEQVRSVNPVVGETNDGWLNDIRGRHVEEEHVLEAIENARGGSIEQGVVGAGTGTICFGFKGGIGTSSRKLPGKAGGYTVGVLVQSNFGGVLRVAGVPVGKELGRYYMSERENDSPEGSCMIVVATDAPLGSRNLERLAQRAMMGLARTGGISSNGSGDYVVAFSTHQEVRTSYRDEKNYRSVKLLRNDAMSPLFMAVIEATEEAIINSLFAATAVTGRNGHTIEELPEDKVLEILDRYGMKTTTDR
jgi:D-aminopeptidase